MRMMKLEVINIGSELIDGTRVNSNLSCIAEKLRGLDCEITRGIIVGDDEKEILEVLDDSFSRVKMIITTGGLGPTLDDVTKKAITKFFNRRLVVDNNVPALVPQASRVLLNPKGTAPGLILEEKDKMLVALPGVPEELNYLLEEALVPYLKQKVRLSSMVRRTFKLYGLTEVELSEKIRLILKRKGLKFSILLRQIEIALKIEAGGNEAVNLIQGAEEEIKRNLGDTIYGMEEETLEEVVGLLLSREKKKISVAESCTAGLISHRLTNVPGSSQYFEGGVIVYSNKAKINLLGLDEKLLREQRAVSEETARAMAVGVKNLTGVALGLAVTGIAGPGGETADKPVGLTFIALAKSKKTIVRKFQFQGERELIKLKASQAALNMVRLSLIKK